MEKVTVTDILHSWFPVGMAPGVLRINITKRLAKVFCTLLEILFETLCTLLKINFGARVFFTLLKLHLASLLITYLKYVLFLVSRTSVTSRSVNRPVSNAPTGKHAKLGNGDPTFQEKPIKTSAI